MSYHLVDAAAAPYHGDYRREGSRPTSLSDVPEAQDDGAADKMTEWLRRCMRGPDERQWARRFLLADDVDSLSGDLSILMSPISLAHSFTLDGVVGMSSGEVETSATGRAWLQPAFSVDNVHVGLSVWEKNIADGDGAPGDDPARSAENMYTRLRRHADTHRLGRYYLDCDTGELLIVSAMERGKLDMSEVFIMSNAGPLLVEKKPLPRERISVIWFGGFPRGSVAGTVHSSQYPSVHLVTDAEALRRGVYKDAAYFAKHSTYVREHCNSCMSPGVSCMCLGVLKRPKSSLDFSALVPNCLLRGGSWTAASTFTIRLPGAQKPLSVLQNIRSSQTVGYDELLASQLQAMGIFEAMGRSKVPRSFLAAEDAHAVMSGNRSVGLPGEHPLLVAQSIPGDEFRVRPVTDDGLELSVQRELQPFQQEGGQLEPLMSAPCPADAPVTTGDGQHCTPLQAGAQLDELPQPCGWIHDSPRLSLREDPSTQATWSKSKGPQVGLSSSPVAGELHMLATGGTAPNGAVSICHESDDLVEDEQDGPEPLNSSILAQSDIHAQTEEQRVEVRKRKNREAAARSNARRKERNANLRLALAASLKRADELRLREVQLRHENMKLRKLRDEMRVLNN